MKFLYFIAEFFFSAASTLQDQDDERQITNNKLRSSIGNTNPTRLRTTAVPSTTARSTAFTGGSPVQPRGFVESRQYPRRRTGALHYGGFSNCRRCDSDTSLCKDSVTQFDWLTWNVNWFRDGRCSDIECLKQLEYAEDSVEGTQPINQKYKWKNYAINALRKWPV